MIIPRQLHHAKGHDRRLDQTVCFGLRRACLDSSVEFHIGDEFWQLILSVKTAPGFLGAPDDIREDTEGAGARRYPGHNMRYAKGPAPAVGDMVDSELALFGP
ncbi:MAG: hypothetical protein WAM29_03895 [Methylocella sp.]